MRDLTGIFVMLGVALALSGGLPAAARAFSVDPGSPLTGETVSFSTPPEDGVTYEWDLNGNGEPDESGASVSTKYMTTGTYTVTLHRTRWGPTGTEVQDVQVGQLPAPLHLLPERPAGRPGGAAGVCQPGQPAGPDRGLRMGPQR